MPYKEGGDADPQVGDADQGGPLCHRRKAGMPTPQLGMLTPQLEMLTPLRGMGPSEGPYRALSWESILGPRALKSRDYPGAPEPQGH